MRKTVRGLGFIETNIPQVVGYGKGDNQSSWIKVWEKLQCWYIDSVGKKRKRDPHIRSVKAYRMKVNQGKEWKLMWEGWTKCMKAQREPRNGKKVSKGETSIGKSAHKLFQEFLKRIHLTSLFFLSSHWKPFNHMWSVFFFPDHNVCPLYCFSII